MGSDPGITTGHAESSGPAALTTRIVDGGLDLAVWWFAAWTVIYHIAVWLDLSQTLAITAMAVAAVAVVVAFVRLVAEPGEGVRASASVAAPPWLTWGSLGAALAATLLMAGRILVPPGWYVAWTLALLAVAPAAAWFWWSAFQEDPTASDRESRPRSASESRSLPSVSCAAAGRSGRASEFRHPG